MFKLENMPVGPIIDFFYLFQFHIKCWFNYSSFLIELLINEYFTLNDSHKKAKAKLLCYQSLARPWGTRFRWQIFVFLRRPQFYAISFQWCKTAIVSSASSLNSCNHRAMHGFPWDYFWSNTIIFHSLHQHETTYRPHKSKPKNAFPQNPVNYSYIIKANF